MVMSTRRETMGRTGDKLGNIGQALPDFVGLQLEGHGATIVYFTQRLKQNLEVDHTFTGREMQVIGVGIAAAVVVEMNVVDSLRKRLDKAQASVLLGEKLTMTQIEGHHESRDLMKDRL